jgi:type I restriction enzyme, S subunit
MVYNPTLKRKIPVGWKDSNILAVSNLLGGGTPTKKKPEYWNGDIPFFTPTDADGGIFKFSTADYITDEGLNGSSTKLFGKNTVFITARGSVGKLVLAGVDMTMNQSCYALRAKSGISHTYLFFLAKELIHHLQVKSSGSVFDSIVSNDIKLTNLAIPDHSVIEEFAAVVEPAFEQIANNTKENQHLIQLRDWLLPMLMNGQVTVA